MGSLNPDLILSFLHQNPTILAQLVSPQPSPSAAPVQPSLTQPGTAPPVPFAPAQWQAPPAPPSQPVPAPPSQPVAAPPSTPHTVAQTQSLPVPSVAIRPYSSLNMLANILAHQPSSSSTFPAQTTISRANQDCLEHSGSSGDSSLTSERKKTRKRSKQAPALQETMPTINQTLNTAENGEVVVNLEVLVCFAMPILLNRKDLGLPHLFYHYKRHMLPFKALLESLGLCHILDNIPLSTRVHDLMKHLVNLCTKAGVHFPSTPGRQSIFSSQALLPIELLAFTSNGHINNNAKTPRLIGTFVSNDMTLADIVYDTRRFAIARHVVTPQSRFILHFAIRSNETIFNANPYKLGLGPEDASRPHRCLGLCTYGLLRNDIDAELDHDYEALDEEAIENRCAASDTSDEEDTVVAQLIVPQSAEAGSSNAGSYCGFVDAQLRLDAISSVTLSTAPSASVVSNTVTQSALATFQAGVAVPVAKLWESTYVSPPRLDALPGFFGFERKAHIFNTISVQYREINDGLECPGIQVKGPNLDALVEQFIDHMRHAANNQDWTPLLCENWVFMHRLVSSGDGLEVEVMNQVFKCLLEDQLHDFCVPLINGWYTLATAPLISNFPLSEAKRKELQLYGAAVGLALVHGQFPLKINPLLLIYLLCGCDLRALSKDLVLEHFPNLYHTLKSWNELNYTDDNLSAFNEHFFTYHQNFLVSSLTHRSQQLHLSLAWTIIFGRFQAPLKGLFDLPQIVNSYFGGISDFVVELMETTIKSFADLRLIIREDIGEWEKRALNNAFVASGAHYRDGTFSTLFQEFLEGVGAPSAGMLDAVKDRYEPLVASTLANLHQKAYHMRMFAWATSGAPRVLPDDEPIKVCLVSDNDPLYAPANQQEGVLEQQLSRGTISFKTCSRYMLIPVSYLIKLLRQPYVLWT
ncbi:hypothetical protein BT96DRAFT_997023 [Gymnopus androsaceus JB14]|uniref:HECT domain-containing protein n=1 Tax=Gymnopus androsaceus JB14 TaxID=1447944 RepID=A0A6A4HE64_9AGAR|nr:hypothetical protein BT96DRAFT_997023 [Gymnopus androsaceus JB14]